MLNFKGVRFPIDAILACIRWYTAYPLSYRHIEEMMEERGVSVDDSSINRWAIRLLQLIEKNDLNHTSGPDAAASPKPPTRRRRTKSKLAPHHQLQCRKAFGHRGFLTGTRRSSSHLLLERGRSLCRAER